MSAEAILGAAACSVGVGVTFVGLAVLCDEWLVPHLEGLQRALKISDDLAGVTILAFGSAAPEISISLISVFNGDTKISASLVMGSALIAFGLIPPLCYFCQVEKKQLELSTWPILRDVGFFLVALGLLAECMFTEKARISMSESGSLVALYFVYVTVCLCFAPPPGVVNDEMDDNSPNTATEAGPLRGSKDGAAYSAVPPANDLELATKVLELTNENLPDSSSETDEARGSSLASAGFGGRIYSSFEQLWMRIFSWTIFPPDEEQQTARGSTGCVMTFCWLSLISSALYHLTSRFCTYVPYLDPATVGATVLAVGAQLPDALGAIALTRAGMHEGAISSALGSQVINITIALGLPWLLYLAKGGEIQLAHKARKQVNTSLLFCLLIVTVTVFFSSVIFDRKGGRGGVQLGKSGAIATLACFITTYVGFFVFEIIAEDKLI
mmetsp:Transcript_1324/g.2808  ORF Transcript_1324/g.2808 Transcript_1324/m.2808 type:complete len:441 (-) Transcript_1324:125-1447(-)|eukprot:CAMPEP_0172611708 /NCGR_PEP_ID=MMETSP1068-20121228/31368_1 /TAXON_ID=35684 /ORGANISM="Pseudopedinella elastica, Strain CCMP716" /LENGTH=440 /DNA_ID=CAMNT_0013415763 /DNA_START=9 /DNA_END=1331 /DNA_ORIENTATION=+